MNTPIFKNNSQNSKKSYKNLRWVLKPCQSTDLDSLFNQRIKGDKDIFFKKSIKECWPKKGDILDIDKGIDIIADAIKNNIKIGIVGDYDVDGSSATGLLVSYFKLINANFTFHIPNRFTEGYGVSPGIIKKLIDKSVEIIITVDNGTTAYEAIEFAKRAKKKFIVIDHHHLQNPINIDAFINPHRSHNGYEVLCATGVAFIFLVELNEYLYKNKLITEKINVFNFIDVVATATICDVMPLVFINRALVHVGIQKINLKPIPGYSAILQEYIGNIDVQTIGYFLGPCINAPGRLGSAQKAVELVTETNVDDSRKIAQELVKMNFDRKEIEKSVLQKAEEQVFSKDFSNKSAIVVCGDWFEGVIGIIAGRIKDKYYKPVCVLAKCGNLWKGSLRSVSGFHVGNAVKAAIEAKIACMGGGHEMAGGISIYDDKLNDFMEFFEDLAKKSNIQPIIDLNIDAIVSLSSINYLKELLIKFAPFGPCNPEPIFLFPNCIITYKRPTKASFLLTLCSPNFQNNIDMWIFGIDEAASNVLSQAKQIHVVGTLTRNKEKTQLKMTDFMVVE